MHLRAWGSAALLSLIIVCGFVFLTTPHSPSRLREASACPAIADVSPRPLGEENLGGVIEKNGGDVFLFDRDHKFKAGVRRDWNGSLVFFGQDDNLLDDSTGERGLQLAFHDDLRAAMGCAAHNSCLDKKSHFQACGPSDEFPGWTAVQGANACGQFSKPLALGAEGEALGVSFTPAQFNPSWNGKECRPLEQSCARDHEIEVSRLRVHQSLRFVRPGVLEIEYLVTNPEDRVIHARHEFPRLYAAPMLNSLYHVRNPDSADKRKPAAETKELVNENGWLSFQNGDGSRGLALLWENHNSLVRTRSGEREKQVTSNFDFDLPAGDTIRGRAYLIAGDATQVNAGAAKLERELPPFGRIDSNEIGEDARTVTLRGWALDNKNVRKLELFVDGKKISDLKLNLSREDVCAHYPGYAMCIGHQTVGFEASYPRPEGQGCDRVVEIKATDDDGNTRVIARTGIRPAA